MESLKSEEERAGWDAFLQRFGLPWYYAIIAALALVVVGSLFWVHEGVHLADMVRYRRPLDFQVYRDAAANMLHNGRTYVCLLYTSVGRGSGFGQRSQRGAQRFGLGAEAANPELAALVGHRRRRGLDGGVERSRQKQTRDEKQRDHCQTAAHVRQDEFGKQGDSPLAGLA